MITSLFDKKTAISESQTSKSLPFSNVNDVGLKENDLILNPVNNILNHFIDNDLYLEQLMINIRDSRNVPGPLVTGLSDVVVNSTDDKKFVLTSTIDDTIICKRKFSSNNDSIISVSFFNNKNVNFIFNDGRYYLVGTDNDWYISEHLSGQWEELNKNDMFKQGFKNKRVQCYAQNSTASRKISTLSGYSYFLGLDDGLWGFCVSDDRTTETYWTQIPPPSKDNPLSCFFVNKSIVDIFSNPNDGKLFVTTSTGDIYSTDGRDVVFKHAVDDGGKVKKVVSVHDEKLIAASEEVFAATSTGIKQSKLCHYLTDDSIERALSTNNAPLATTLGINSDGTLEYIGTTNGVYNSSGNALTATTGVIKKILRTSNNSFYGLGTNNKLYKLGTSSTVSNIIDFDIGNNTLFYIDNESNIYLDSNIKHNISDIDLKLIGVDTATSTCLVLGDNYNISAFATDTSLTQINITQTTTDENDTSSTQIPLIYSLSDITALDNDPNNRITTTFTSLACINSKPVVAFSISKHGFSFNYLSSTIGILTMSLPEPVISMTKRQEDEIVITTNSTISVYNSTLNTIKEVRLDFSNTDNTIKFKFPIHSPYIGDDNGYAIVNSKYIVKFSKHTMERLFRKPFDDYEILETKFKNLDIETLYVPKLDIVDAITVGNNEEENQKNREKELARLIKDMYIGGKNFTGFTDNMHIALKYVESTLDAVRDDYLTGETKAIAETTGDSDDEFRPKYIFSSGTSIYKTINGYTISKELYSILPEDCTINFILAEDTYNYVICTDKGMFLTDPIYKPFDQMNINSLESVSKNILDRISAEIDLHIRVSHVNNAFLTALDKKCPAKLDAVPDTFTAVTPIQYNNSVVEIRSDVVNSIEFNDVNRFIKASVSNWATEAVGGEAIYSSTGYIDRFKDPVTAEEIDLSMIPYIYKSWNSGLKEFYIYLPTTLTYYINNPKGFSNSLYTESTVPRRNLGASVYSGNTVPTNYTKIRVILDNNHFNIKNISHVEINGSSLPLKIYKDDTYCQEGRENIFDTVIQPSLVVSFPATIDQSVNNINSMITSDNDLIIEFAAYGSDAQSIKIIAN